MAVQKAEKGFFTASTKSHIVERVSVYAGLINFGCFHSVTVEFFSLNFFSCYSADKIAQIQTELSTAMETVQYSQEDKHCIFLLVLHYSTTH